MEAVMLHDMVCYDFEGASQAGCQQRLAEELLRFAGGLVCGPAVKPKSDLVVTHGKLLKQVFSNDSLEGRFALLETSSVDDELLKLKTDLVASGKTLPPPRASTPLRAYETLGAYNNVDIIWP